MQVIRSKASEWRERWRNRPKRPRAPAGEYEAAWLWAKVVVMGLLAAIVLMRLIERTFRL